MTVLSALDSTADLAAGSWLPALAPVIGTRAARRGRPLIAALAASVDLADAAAGCAAGNPLAVVCVIALLALALATAS